MSVRKAGTREFADEVIARLGRKPAALSPVDYQPEAALPATTAARRPAARKEMVGVDVFLHWSKGSPRQLAETLQQAETHGLKLAMITNRGVKVWPDGLPETFCTDHWRCRFQASTPIAHPDVLALLARLAGHNLDFIKTENLCTFDGQPGYSLGQGQ